MPALRHRRNLQGRTQQRARPIGTPRNKRPAGRSNPPHSGQASLYTDHFFSLGTADTHRSQKCFSAQLQRSVHRAVLFARGPITCRRNRQGGNMKLTIFFATAILSGALAFGGLSVAAAPQGEANKSPPQTSAAKAAPPANTTKA